jgi:hypothetical protein
MQTRHGLVLILLPGIVLTVGNPLLAEDVNRPVQLRVYSDLRSHQWEEFTANGSRLLKESGLLNGLGFALRFSLGKERRFFIEPEIGGYIGKVDLDGFLQDNLGNRTPYTTKTGYRGLEVSASVGYVFSVTGEFQLTLMSGTGFEYWNRDIDDGGRFGYDEKYTVFSQSIALKPIVALSRAVILFVGVTVDLPFSISESVDLASRGQGGPSDISLSPGVEPRFQVEGGVRIYSIAATMYFKTWTLSESPQDRQVYQPESTRRVLGFRIAYEFGS